MGKDEQLSLIEFFYTAFSNKDHRAMAACYHSEAEFRDAVFSLQGKEISAMWHMLCEKGKDMELTFSVSEQNGQILAHWEPVYTFSQTGNRVCNIIDATFEFKDGKIFRHYDQFNFWRWSRQAFSVVGVLIGWTSFFLKKVRQGAEQGLTEFIQKHPEYQNSKEQ